MSEAMTMAPGRAAQLEQLRRLPRPLLWVVAARLKTLSLSVAPVLAGTLLAAERGNWRWDVLVCAALAAVAIQAGTNLWNDAADAARGVDTEERLGPPRITALGLLDGGTVRRGAMAAFALAAVLGLYLSALGGWPVVVIGLASLLAGYLYSMGPRPLSMTPFGEALVIVFFGVIAVAGSEYLQSGVATQRGLLLGAIFGLPAAAVLLLNNHRDRRTDSRGGRRTLAILLGEQGSRFFYAGLLMVAAVGMAVWSSAVCLTAAWLAMPLFLVAFALSWRMFRLAVSSALNSLLLGTALYQVLMVAVVAAQLFVCR